MKYRIRFDFPDQGPTMWAGWCGDVLGLAPTVATAAEFDTAEIAQNWIENNYPVSGQYARVEEVKTDG